MESITIALGPGFNAGVDVDVVIETMRGHNLGRLIFEGYASKNTGIPGMVDGYSKERVIYSPCDGKIKNIKTIGEYVKAGEVVAVIGKREVRSSITGILRGIVRDESIVFNGLKIADVDPRLTELENFNTISDKARNIGGGALEAILFIANRQKHI